MNKQLLKIKEAEINFIELRDSVLEYIITNKLIIGNIITIDDIDKAIELIDENDIKEIKPFYLGFKGTIEKNEKGSYISKGIYKWLDDSTLEITELPIGTWTENYKEYLEDLIIKNNTIKLNNSTTSVQIGTFIRIFRNYAKNQLEIVQYFLSSDEPIIIKKLLKLLDIHSAVLKNFASQQKSNGGILPEDLLRELEDFVNSSIGFSESG